MGKLEVETGKKGWSDGALEIHAQAAKQTKEPYSIIYFGCLLRALTPSGIVLR